MANGKSRIAPRRSGLSVSHMQSPLYHQQSANYGEVVRNSKLTTIVALGALAVAASACGSSAQTGSPTRVATQTPWIIYVPVTTTPEPATVTPLPTATSAQPTRAPTRIPPTKAPASKAPPTPVPVAAAPTKTSAPACDLGTIAPPYFPANGDPRTTRADGSGGSAIVFTWTPPSALTALGDPHVGYMIQMESHRPNGQHVNGVTIYVSANKYLQDGRAVLDQRAVSGLAAGDDAIATWNVTVVRVSGDFDENNPTVRPAGLTTCGAPSPSLSVRLIISG